jgi:hypothetical protein
VLRHLHCLTAEEAPTTLATTLRPRAGAGEEKLGKKVTANGGLDDHVPDIGGPAGLVAAEQHRAGVRAHADHEVDRGAG